MGKCRSCGRESIIISDVIGYCVDCLRGFKKVPDDVARIHLNAWRVFGVVPSSNLVGFKCGLCVNNCLISREFNGLCGNYVYDGSFKNVFSSFDVAYGSWYYDPHPTNCVAFPVCPAITGSGYPRYALSPNGERGYYNLAVFYATCSLSCLYCQNWSGRVEVLDSKRALTVDELVTAALDRRVTCVCFFGGDPAPNIVHALKASRVMLSKSRGRILRICWETNGTVNPTIMREMSRLSLESGGIVKIDLKAWSPQVYEALTGVNAIERVKENIKVVASMINERKSPPLLVVSVLLVPGYVDDVEINGIATFISSINPEIPVVLLAFYPHFILSDLPRTSRRHMYTAINLMKKQGINNVFIGNEWLLSNDY